MSVIVKNPGGPVIGLDIGSNFIKACQAQVRGGRPEVTAMAVLPTPSDSVSGTEIIDPVALGRVLKQLLAQSGFKAKKVVSSVAGQSSLVVRIIEVPKMTPKELAETMKWEVERHVPFAADQTVMDFQTLSVPEEVPDGQNMEVLLAVAQGDTVNRHVQALQAAGLQPGAIDIEPLAASRSLVALSDNGNPTGTVALVDIGANTTDISIFKDGRLSFTRSVQIAGNTLTKAISDVLGQPLPAAERLKKELATAPEGAAFGEPGFETQVGDLGSFDFGEPGGETLTFGEPAAAPEPAATFDVAGGGIGASPFADTLDGPVFADPMGITAAQLQGAPEDAPAAATPAGFSLDAPSFSPPGLGVGGPEAGLGAGGPEPELGTGGPEAGGPPPTPADIFGAPPVGDPFGGDMPGASPFGAPVAAQSVEPSLPVVSNSGGVDEYLRQQIADAVTPVLNELVTELRRSLDFYRNRANGQGAQRICVVGGTTRMPGLVQFLDQSLDASVVLGNPMEYVNFSARADSDYLAEVAPMFPVSVGLAIRDMLVDAPVPKVKGRK